MMQGNCMHLYSQCHAKDLDTMLQLCASKPLAKGVCGRGVCGGEGGGQGAGPKSIRPCPFVCMRHDGLCQHHRCHVVKITACPQRLKQLRQPVHSGRETTRTRATNTPPVQRGEIFISGSR